MRVGEKACQAWRHKSRQKRVTLTPEAGLILGDVVKLNTTLILRFMSSGRHSVRTSYAHVHMGHAIAPSEGENMLRSFAPKIMTLYSLLSLFQQFDYIEETHTA